jgi:beta-glucosidase
MKSATALEALVLVMAGLVATGCGSLPGHADGSARHDGPEIDRADAADVGSPDQPTSDTSDAIPVDRADGAAADSADGAVLDSADGATADLTDGASVDLFDDGDATAGDDAKPADAAPDAATAGRATDWADDRIRALIAQMTLSEKIQQLANDAPAIPRLGLAAYNYWSEGLHGVMIDGATSFPQAIALASTWDPALLERVASAISDEARGFNVKSGKGLTYWSPVINMLRDPRWGRFDESYSEDPWLMARMGVAFVRGLQGNHPKYLKAVSTPKHFAGNNSEVNRHNGSSNIDEQLLYEYYLPAFEATVKAGAFSVMAAYNEVNGVPASANTLLLHDILRANWGFRGYVVSDCDAVWDIANSHHWTSTLAEAAAKALVAGTDLNCGRTYPDHLQEALDQSLIAEVDIDRALTRVLRARFLLGEFDADSEVPFRSIGPEVIQSKEHQALALEAARAAVVLLKNDNLLPLDRDAVHSLAVIGPHAADVTLGGYSGGPSHRVSALDGIRAKLGDEVVACEPGGTITGDKDQPAIDRAAEVARSADVAVVLVGTSQQVLSEEMDRPDWSLPGAQGDLIQAVYAANPKTIVVLVTAAPVAVDWAQANVPAIVCAFYDGQEQGSAIADVLFGDTNPGGKLTTTWYTGAASLPPIEDYDLRKGRTYLYYEGTPLYPFGHGLSYTSFAYSRLRVEPAIVARGGTAQVTVEVKNTGDRAGDEVVQLYTHQSFAAVPRPLKELRGFARVHLEAGQSQSVSFPISTSDLAYWDVSSHGWRVDEAVFDVAVGSSSADIRQQGTLTVRTAGTVDAAN